MYLISNKGVGEKGNRGKQEGREPEDKPQERKKKKEENDKLLHVSQNSIRFHVLFS